MKGDGTKQKLSCGPSLLICVALRWLPGEPAKFPSLKVLSFTICKRNRVHLTFLQSTGDLSRVWGLWTAEFGPSMFVVVPVWTRFILAAWRGKAPYPISSPLSHPAFHARLFYLENMTTCGKQYLQFSFLLLLFRLTWNSLALQWRFNKLY